MICNLDTINDVIIKEKINLLVISYGGCASNTLTNVLEKNNYTIKTKTWHKLLCHCPKYIETDIPIIYIYDNPIKSFLSMKRRKQQIWGVNQKKLSNNNNIVLSDENLLKLMINQFNSWTNIRRDNILIIKSCELFKNSVLNKLECFLKRKLNYFPLQYINPNISIKNIEEQYKYNKLFKKYKLEIDKINHFTMN